MATKKPSKAQKEAREFATLYVNGPAGLQGNWQACEQSLKRTADNQDSLIREAIYAEGGQIPDKMPSARPEVSDFAAIDLSIFESKGSAAKTDEDWRKLAKELEPTIRGIADGSIKANAAQTAIVKHIMDRAYGRAGLKEDKVVVPSGVIILPTLGERSDMKVCPQCRYVLEQKYPRVEDDKENV